MTSFSKAEMNKASKNIRNSIKKGAGVPKSLKMIARENNKKVTVNKAHFAGLFESQNIFIRHHGRYPNYVTLNSTANNPLVMDYQDNAYTCGPTSLSMASQMLYGYTSEKAFAKACKTNKNGTSPDNLIAGAKSLGYNVTPIGRNFKSVSAALAKGYAVVIHYETGGGTKPKCMGFLNNYGHYALIFKAKDNYYWIADPTKGIKKCKASEIDKATNGRSIHYYKVVPK